jgi:hypothetical protein
MLLQENNDMGAQSNKNLICIFNKNNDMDAHGKKKT